MRSIALAFLAAGCAHSGLYDNLGGWHHEISCKSVQGWFDQGLRFAYAFNHDEAIRSFEQAARLDPECAMAWWGIAYANGPHINNPMLQPERARAAWIAVERARAAQTKTGREREWIEAMAARYSADPNAARAPLDEAYADAMRALARRHPDDSDALTLFGEAVMDVHPWDMWQNDGRDQPWTAEVVAALEAALAQAPDNPGANHYYIHALEQSKHAERALPAAERLRGGLVPGAAHLIHMPSHVYLRLGRYEDAAASNRRAIEVDAQYVAKQPRQSNYLLYKAHNFHFLFAAAMMEGRSAEALRAARDLNREVPSMVDAMGCGVALLPLPTPWFAMTRFGRWDDVLAEPPPPDRQPIATALWHYVRGIAFVRKGRLDEAGREHDAVAAAVEGTSAHATIGLSPARRVLGIAERVLAGEIAAARQRTEEAVALLAEAARDEDLLHYDQPADWLIPVRQTLGAVLLETGRPLEAETVYREDLERNPENGWSLFGLAQALRQQHKTVDAEAVRLRFQKAWGHADVTLTSSRF